LLSQRTQCIGVMVGEFHARRCRQLRPRAAFGQLNAAFIRHLDEQQIGDLLDVVAVIDSIVTEHVAETPELLNDVRHSC
jgi:hypothetical protein